MPVKIEIPIQYWANPDPVIESKFNPIKNASFLKPDGGLWTSTWSQTEGSAWVQWCLENDFRVPQEKVFQGHKLWMYPEAKVFIIDCLEDLQEAMEVYKAPPLTHYIHLTEHLLDYEAMRNDGWDAIYLTEKGQGETHLPLRLGDPSLYGWDCESWLWLTYQVVRTEPWAFIAPHNSLW